jgi:phenylacetate-CoA ligase
MSAPALDRTTELRELVRRAMRLPYLAEKYRDVDLGEGFEFAAVPEMSRDDVTASARQAAQTSRRSGHGGRAAYLFTSGGSTAEPKIAWIPAGFHLGELTPHWQPLTSADTLANLAMPGRLWSAHYFYNRLAELAGAGVVGLGHVSEEEMAQWVDFLHVHGVTALAGTPTQLATVLRHCVDHRHPLLDRLRVGIWFGEPCGPELLDLLAGAVPGMRLWGNYGSTETWVIGHNGPGCAPDTFHPMPYQHVEIADGAVLVSTLHPDAVSPVIRYRLGDRGSFQRCACGRDGALRVLGREGSLVKFAGTLVSPQDLVAVACDAPGVRAAQIAILPGEGAREEVLEVRVVADAGTSAAEVRARLLDSHIDLRFGLRGDEEAVRIRFVERLASIARTAKTPALLREAS